MIVKFKGETRSTKLIHGKEYEVISVEKEWYRIIDETEEDYFYSPVWFEIVEE